MEFPPSVIEGAQIITGGSEEEALKWLTEIPSDEEVGSFLRDPRNARFVDILFEGDREKVREYLLDLKYWTAVLKHQRTSVVKNYEVVCEDLRTIVRSVS